MGRLLAPDKARMYSFLMETLINLSACQPEVAVQTYLLSVSLYSKEALIK